MNNLRGSDKAGELIFLLTGIIPNRKGHPLIQKWFGVSVANGSFQQIKSLETLLDRTRLNQTTFSNPGNLKVSEQAQDLLPSVIVKAQTWMKEDRHAFENMINPQLNEHLDRLELLKSRHNREIQLHFDDLDIAETIKTRRKGEREREVEQLFAEYMEWIEDTMSTEDQAYIKVVAVLQGVEMKE